MGRGEVLIMATLDFTRQWTRLIGVRSMEGRQVRKALSLLEKANEFPAQPQYIILATGMAQAVENGMPISMPTLAEEILAGQAKRVKKYRKDAYPLSKKQVNAILSEVKQWPDRPQEPTPQQAPSQDPDYCPMCGGEDKHHPSCEVYS